MSFDQRLVELGIELPEDVPPGGNYVRAKRVGDLLFISGHLPDSSGWQGGYGKVGAEFTVAQAYDAARMATVGILGTVRKAVGSLDRVKQVVKVFGMVHSDPEFILQPRVVDGASDLLYEVFGEAGVHSRTAGGAAQLPRGNPVEIEAVFEVD